LDNREKD
jgi:hypothetical protein